MDLEIRNSKNISIGNNVIISCGVLVSCNLEIRIGNDVQIGEYTSIRDSTHDYSNNIHPIKGSPDKFDRIIIGNDVWIGRGCVIMPRSVIEDRVIVGANSVVKGYLKSNWVYGEVPAKQIKNLAKNS